MPEWLPEQLELFVQYRLATLRVDPSARPWLGRALVLTDAGGARRVIGTVGFHAPPDEAGRLEIGYRVDPAYRRGLPVEAVRGLLDRAAARGVHRFVASISPDNKASLSLAAKLGFDGSASRSTTLTASSTRSRRSGFRKATEAPQFRVRREAPPAAPSPGAARDGGRRATGCS